MSVKNTELLKQNLDSDQMYIIGQPINLPIGIIYPVRVSQYEELSVHMGALFVDSFDVTSTLKELEKKEPDFEELVKYSQSVDFFTFLTTFKDKQYKGSFLYDLYDGQKKLFEFLFREDVFDNIRSDDELKMYRRKIIEMNNITYEKPNPNPELARLDELKSKLAEMKGENITFEAMYTSVLLSCSININDLTLYQLNKAFDRIVHFKNYETTTLFKTVDTSGKMDISPWYGTTREKAPSTISQEQLDEAKELQSRGGLSSKL